MPVKRIRTLKRLMDLAISRKSVAFSGWDGPKPAAFMVGMTGRTLYGFMELGLYEYKPKKKIGGLWKRRVDGNASVG